MFDRDILRNKQLIEERIEYENSFILIEDIIKSGELDYYTTTQFEEYFNEDYEFNCEDIFMDYSDFEFEEYLNELCDEQLIEERLAYENAFISEIDENISEYDPLGAQIESLDYEYSPEFEYYDDYFDDYVEEINMDAAYYGNTMFGYIVDENESFDEYDYPEGPDENLSGFRFPEPDYLCECFDYSIPDIELSDEFYDYPEAEYEIQDDLGVYLYDEEESHMQNLINQQVREEKEFYEFVEQNEIPDEYYIPAGMNDIILS